MRAHPFSQRIYNKISFSFSFRNFIFHFSNPSKQICCFVTSLTHSLLDNIYINLK